MSNPIIDSNTLPFEHRQAIWKGNKRIFRQLHGRQDRPIVWEIWVEGDRYFTRHGLLGGQMQETNKVGKVKNNGKINEISAEVDALAEARRLCRKKYDFEGFDEFYEERNLDLRGGTPSIPHLLTNLPGNFSLYKPGNNLLEATTLLKKAEAGKVVYALKRNGMAIWVIVNHARDVQIYSRRNRPWHKDEGPVEKEDGTLDYSNAIPIGVRYPHIIRAVQMLNLPPNTMLACELVNVNGDTKNDFSHVQSVEKSLTPVAIKKQNKNGWLGLYCWDIPFWHGEDWVSTYPVIDRYDHIQDLFKGYLQDAKWFSPIEYREFKSTGDAIKYAKIHDLEGWVVVDPHGIYGDKGWNLKGKPDRPKAFCAKLKPWLDDDFIAMWDPSKKWGTIGKGKHEKDKLVTLPNGQNVHHGGVGSVGLFQFNNNHELVYICDCSSGMDYEFQAQLRPENFPFVAEVKYVDRSYISDGDDTNALTFPGFVRMRTDKSPEECINENL